MNITKIRRWLKDNSFDCKLKKDKYFYYDFIEDCIHISDTLEECDHMDAYMKYIKHLGYKGDFKLKTICFLHELGHAETMCYCNGFEFILEHLKSIIETPSNNMFMLNIKAFIYFRLPIERKATMWAIDYIKYNSEEVAELNRLL